MRSQTYICKPITLMSKIFIEIFTNFDGILMRRRNSVPEELNDFYALFFDNDEMLSQQNDKANMIQDFKNFKNDFRNSRAEAKKNLMHEQRS